MGPLMGLWETTCPWLHGAKRPSIIFWKDVRCYSGDVSTQARRDKAEHDSTGQSMTGQMTEKGDTGADKKTVMKPKTQF